MLRETVLFLVRIALGAGKMAKHVKGAATKTEGPESPNLIPRPNMME